MPVAAVLWSPSVAQAHVAALYALPSPAALFPRSRPGLAACPAEHAASALQAEAAARRALLLFDSAPRLADAACSVWVGEQPSLGRPLGARGCLGAAPLPEQPAVCTSSSAPAACGSACVLSSAEAAASRPDGEAPSASMSASARLLQCGPAAHTSAERSVTAAAPAAAIPAVALAAAAAAAAAAAEAEAAAAAAAARARSDPSAAAAVLRSLAAPAGVARGWLGRAACGQQHLDGRRLAHAVRSKQPHGAYSGRRGRGRVRRACTSRRWRAWGPRLCSRVGSGGTERLSQGRAGARQPARGAPAAAVQQGGNGGSVQGPGAHRHCGRAT